MNAEQKLGYSITIFVAGERFSGLRTVDKINWNGRGLICSRAFVPNLRNEMKKAGVYLLLGPPEQAELPRVYVGNKSPSPTDSLKEGDVFEFSQNYPFSSPSLAASVVAANNCSARGPWKNKAGKTLREIQDKEAKE